MAEKTKKITRNKGEQKTYYAPSLASLSGYVVICPRRADEVLNVKDGYIFNGWKSYKIGTQAFDTIAGAQKKAEELRKRKIASLEKQILKLEALSFFSAQSD